MLNEPFSSISLKQDVAEIRSRISQYLRSLGKTDPEIEDVTEGILRIAGQKSQGAAFRDRAFEALENYVRQTTDLPSLLMPPMKRTAMLSRPLEEDVSGLRHRTPTFNDHILSRIKNFRRTVFFLIVTFSSVTAAISMTRIVSSNEWLLIKVPLITVFTLLFTWLSFNFWTAVMGFVARIRGDSFVIVPPHTHGDIDSAARTAVVLPIKDEDVKRVFSGLRVIFESTVKTGQSRQFDFFILSDSSDPDQWVAEEAAWSKLCRDVQGWGQIFYRRRRSRIHKKSGNISDFCRRWGAHYKYMVTLDADSLVSGNLLVKLVHVMEHRADIGILQTAPKAINHGSLISRVQQFASHVYGPLFYAGLNFWQMDESGFWGHNAIIRMEPFIKYCALPRLKGRPPFGGEIMSHDFVEAALMRRAGWGVWLAHQFEESYEELPPNLLEELERDRRWCQGNMQHLSLVATPGFTLGHRLLFISGNLFYFSSFMWFLLLILMTVHAVAMHFQNPVYFPQAHSLFPKWPIQYPVLSMNLLAVTAVFLMAPKVLSILLVAFDRKAAGSFGGMPRLLVGVLLETVFSALLAPIRMWFHTRYVLINLIGQTTVWKRQFRHHKAITMEEAIRAHWVGTLFAVVWGIVSFAVNQTLFWWMSVIIVPLALSIPLSIIFSLQRSGTFFRKLGIFLTEIETRSFAELRKLKRFMAHQAGPEGWRSAFQEVLLDPLCFLLHTSLLDRGARRRRSGFRRKISREVEEKAIQQGPHSLGLTEKFRLLYRSESLRRLHRFVWSAPKDVFKKWQ